MKKWIWLLPLGLSLGCLGKPTVQANDPATSNSKPNNPTDIVVDAGQEPEDEFDLNETWTNLITDGGPLQGFYEDGGTLSCLPEEWPEVDNPISAILDFASLRIYSGSAEEGVTCDGTNCAPGTPCCVICGLGFCGEPGVDGGMGSCPISTRSIGCDDNEDCRPSFGGDTCCMTLGGTDCRAEENCAFSFDFSSGNDGGFSFGGFSGGDGGILTIDTDSGITVEETDGGVEVEEADGGTAIAGEEIVDGGAAIDEAVFDAGIVATFDSGLPVDILDGGMSYVDAGMGQDTEMSEELGFWETNGFPVCARAFDCDLFGGEVCCTSDRFTAVDIGVCLPIWLCLGNSLADGFGQGD